MSLFMFETAHMNAHCSGSGYLACRVDAAVMGKRAAMQQCSSWDGTLSLIYIINSSYGELYPNYGVWINLAAW